MNVTESRLKVLRKEMRVRTESDGKVRSLSREALGNYLDCTRQRVAEMEKDIDIATVGEIKKLCELFECDAVYLFGEIDTKRRRVADIREHTGLSEESVIKLAQFKSKNIPTDFLDDLLSDGDVPFRLAIIYSRLITERARNPQKECQYRYFLFSEFEKFVRNAVEKAKKGTVHEKPE